MVRRARDRAIETIIARRGHSCYGMGLGIILLDDVYPGFPGDVRNASAYDFPIQYEIAESVDIEKLVREDNKQPYLEPVVQAARKLERMGCRAIAAECGYFSYFQKEIASAVDVPVFMSSLLQIPLAQQLINPKKVVGVLVADSEFLTEAHLTSVGVTLGSNYVVAGAMDGGQCPEFANLWTADKRPELPTANFDKAEADLLKVAMNFAEAYSNMGALVLECTGFQPFARTIQRHLDIPIFSWSTLLDYAFSVAVHRDFYGHV
jgi:hypothetical protein